MRISIENARDKFKDILTGMADWAVLKRSQFVDHLGVFQAWALRSALWEVERTRQEAFAATALNRSSILAHAEDREYLPRKPEPATGDVLVKNNGAHPMSIPIHQHFIASSQRSYVATDAVAIAPGETGTLPVAQMLRHIIETVVDAERPFYEVFIERELAGNVHSFTVWVDEGEGDFEQWDYARLFQRTHADSKVFDERYNRLDQIVICFGNGHFGKIPPLGAKVRIEAWLTDGKTTLLPGQPLHIVGSLLDSASIPVKIDVKTQTPITGGSAPETTEEIRRNIHYWPIYNERLIWQEDYVYHIKKNHTDIVWMKVWGEQEAEAFHGPRLAHVNVIHVTAYSPTDPAIGEKIMETLSEVHLLNRRFRWVDPIFSTFRLTIDGVVSRSRVLSDVERSIRDSLTQAYGKDSRGRMDEVYVKDFYRFVNATGQFAEPEAYFTILHEGTVTPTALEEMIHIDIDNTVITLEYA